MSNEVYLDPTFLLENISPVLDDEAFLVFLELYYDWMQTSELTISSTSGTFQREEVVIGLISGARGIVKQVKSGSLILQITSSKPFDLKETLTGQTSSATATLDDIKDNVLKHSANLLNNKDPNFASGKYLEYLKTEFNNLYPTETEADRRELVAKLRSLYESKSTEEAYRFLFRSVFNESIEFRYPGEELLRVSDGKFEKTIILRVVPNDTIFDFLNETIRGASSGAVGNVVDIKLTFLGGIQYAEFTLSLVSGTFSADETIFAVNDGDIANTTTYGILSSVTINDGGSGYSVGDVLTVTGDGSEATATVSSISDGPINKLKINEIGQGYRLNTVAAVDNTGTGGSSLYIKVTELANTYVILQPVGPGFNQYTVGEISKVSILNRGENYAAVPTVTLIDTTIKNLGSLHETLITIDDGGNNYAVGDQLTFSGGSPTTSANGLVASVGNTSPYGEENILFEDSFVLIQESVINGKSSAIKSEDWSNSGPILRIELYDTANAQSSFGFGYAFANLSSVTITVSSGAGSNADFTVTNIQGNNANVEVDVANNAVGIGAIRAVEVSNFGIDYSSATIDATGSGDGNANLSAVISGTGISSGRFINDDGKIDYRIIQDSLFYQDFSYVIKSALTLNRYSSLVKELVHPAGLEFFGEISIISLVEDLPVTASTFIDFPRDYAQVISLYENIPTPIQSVYKRYRIWGTRDTPVGAEFRGNVVPIYEANAQIGVSNTRIARDLVYEENLSISTHTNYVNLLQLTADVSIQNLESIVRSFSELQIYLQPVSVASEFTPRETEIDIELNRNLSITHLTEYVNRLELYLNVSTTWFSEIQVLETSTKIELELVLDGTSLVTTESRELQIRITPEVVSESLATSVEYVNRLELYVDATMAFYSDVVVMEAGIQPIEIDIELYQSVQSLIYKQFEIDLPAQKIVYQKNIDSEYVNKLKSEIDLVATEQLNKVKSEISSVIQLHDFNQFRQNSITYGDTLIETLANRAIEDEQNKTFESLFGERSIVKNVKISGAVSLSGTIVIGTATNFVSDFSVDDSLIVENEKFIVTSVSNSTYMTINVNPAGSYLSVSAYKEVTI